MIMPGGKESRYRVIYSELTRKTLQELGEKAKQLGIGQEFLSAVKTIDSRLHSDPLDFGEFLYSLKDTDLEVRIGNHHFLFVRYGVDKKRALVYVAACIVLSGHGF
jgi:hypothetical protein